MSSIMGDRIKFCRKAANMTLEELGKKINVQKSGIRKYEKGDVENIPRHKIQIMADLFGVSPCWLMGFTDNMAVTVNSEPVLSNDEKQLLGLFSKLDTIDKAKLIERAESLLDQDKYSIQDESLNA